MSQLNNGTGRYAPSWAEVDALKAKVNELENIIGCCANKLNISVFRALDGSIESITTEYKDIEEWAAECEARANRAEDRVNELEKANQDWQLSHEEAVERVKELERIISTVKRMIEEGGAYGVLKYLAKEGE